MEFIYIKVIITASNFKICPRNTANLAKCVKEAIEGVRPNLKDGKLADGFQIEPMEPLVIEDIEIKRGPGFWALLSNLKAYSATNFKIEKMRINVEKFKVDLIVLVPRIDAIGKYKLQMALGPLNMKGEGQMKATVGE